MHQVVEIVLGILPTEATTPDAAFNLIGNYARGKWNVDLDRAAFEERWQGPAESFEDLHISLIRFADAADLSGACIDCRMATGELAGIRDSETKKKLALSPFPTTEAAVNLCRSVESAQTDEKIFSTQTGVSSIQAKQNGRLSSSDASSCGFRGRSQHPAGQIYPAIGKPRPPGDSGGSRHENGGDGNKTDGGIASQTKMARICIGNMKATHRDRRTPIIAVEGLGGNGLLAWSFDNVTPDTGAEVSLGGLEFISAIGLSESDLSPSSVDLVMADKSAPFPSIGQSDVRIRYVKQSAAITVVICPEIQGVLLSWLEFIAPRILHSNYPLPRLPASAKMVTTPASCSTDVASSVLENLNILLSPSVEQEAESKSAVANRFPYDRDQSTELRCMMGPERIIQLQEEAIPYYVNRACLIPFADRSEITQLLYDYVGRVLIAPAEEATDRAAPLVVLRCYKIKLRIVVVHTRLYRFVRRPAHPARTPRDAVAEIDSGENLLPFFDAANGSYQIPLRPPSQLLTIVMSP
jgi:hypothetical protein